jgi:hypothetical protein
VPTGESVEDKANRVMKWSDQILMIDPVKSTMVRVYEVNSSHMSTIGSSFMFDPPTQSRWVFISFKGATRHYRYHPLTQKQWEELLTEAIKTVEAGDPNASAGTAFWDILRKPAESGKLICERYEDGGVWKTVPAKDPNAVQKKRDK